MPEAIRATTHGWSGARLAAAGALVLLALTALYRAWIDIAVIAWQDPESSQVILALPVVALLLYTRRAALVGVAPAGSFAGTAVVGAGWLMSVYGYFNAGQTLWHLGAVAMVIGAVWSVLGARVMLTAWPAWVAMMALVPVPQQVRLEIALPLQRLTASGAEFVLVALGFEVERLGQTLFYMNKPVTIEEACNGMRMVFALLLVCYAYAMASNLNPFARVLLIGLSPLMAVLSNITRVVPTVVIYGRWGDGVGDVFHDISGWAMILAAPVVLFGVMRLLEWAEVPVYLDERAKLPKR